MAVAADACRARRVWRVSSSRAVFFWFTHVIGCIFFAASRNAHASHYADAPWSTSGEYNVSSSGDAMGSGTAAFRRYLRSNYWSMMTLTTTGHVDIINTLLELEANSEATTPVRRFCFCFCFCFVLFCFLF